MTHRLLKGGGLMAVLSLVLPPLSANAGLITAEADGYWTNSAVWGGSPPAAGDDVVIPSGFTVYLDEATEALSSAEVSGTLRFDGWQSALNATNVTVKDGGSLTLPGPFGNAGPSNRVWVVGSTFTLESGASINADAKGFSNANRSAGSGPGGGAAGEFGAGHAGHGLPVSSLPFNGRVYGDPREPVTPGSAGGGSWTPQGGHGGGAVRIEATGHVRIDGTISANGGDGAKSGSIYGGGGSGGSVYVSCLTFEGGAGSAIDARGGGVSASTCPGGGGRIAIHYDIAEQSALPVPQTVFATRPGGTGLRADAMGTLYLSGSTWVSEPFSNFNGGWFHGDWATNWTSPGSLTPSGTVGFGESNAFIVINGDLTLDAVAFGVSRGSELHCENLTLTNSGSLSALSALIPIPAGNLTTNTYGALVSVTNTLRLESGSWIYPVTLMRPYTGIKRTNDVPALFRATDVIVATNAGFNANRFGHPAPSSRTANTWGNGGGVGSGRGRGDYSNSRGASHGGLGVNATAIYLYGSSNAPVFAGSGGGGGWSGTGAAGGGSIRIQATGSFVLDGTLTANAAPRDNQGTGGAGGSILVLANTFSGGVDARLRAQGSTGHNNSSGSGGRISVGVGFTEAQIDELFNTGTVDELIVYETHDPFLGQLIVTGGTDAEDGSKQFMTVPQEGTFTVTIAGDPAEYGTPGPKAYGTHLNIPDGTWITNAIATPADEADGTRRAGIGWTLRNLADEVLDTAAFSTQAVFEVTNDLVLVWHWTNEYQLIVQDTTGGTVNSNVHNGWYTNHVVVEGIEASAAGGYTFHEWADDLPFSNRMDNPVVVTMTQPRTLRAHFYSDVGETRTWNGIGIWEDATNWTPSGMAGPNDTAIIASGTSTLGNPRTVRNLSVNNGGILTFSNWSTVLTSDTVTVNSGGSVTLPAAFSNAGMSNRIHIVSRVMTIEEGGQVNANSRGFRSGTQKGNNGHGPGWGHSISGGAGGGGSHGGQGGYDGSLNAGGGIYGDTNAPVIPGSGGGGGWSANGGDGGGAIRLIASEALTVDGTITANGGSTGGGGGGGGSGGAIYITCGLFDGGDTAQVSARGGASGAQNGGAGGRIAIHYGGGRMKPVELVAPEFDGTVTVTGGGSTSNVAGEDGTLRWWYAEVPPAGTLFIFR